jgi:hypothetical protein
MLLLAIHHCWSSSQLVAAVVGSWLYCSLKLVFIIVMVGGALPLALVTFTKGCKSKGIICMLGNSDAVATSQYTEGMQNSLETGMGPHAVCEVWGGERLPHQGQYSWTPLKPPERGVGPDDLDPMSLVSIYCRRDTELTYLGI